MPPTLDGQFRRSYVLWQEHIAPLVVLEFVSGNGSEERDKTPWKGKFWIYEQVIRPAFYGIYEVQKSAVEVYRFVEDHFELMAPNQRGHYPIPQMRVELGIWQGQYQGSNLPWMRWWDLAGNLLLTGWEQTEQERQQTEQEHQRAEQEHQRAEQEQQRAERLAAQLRALGVEPEA